LGLSGSKWEEKRKGRGGDNRRSGAKRVVRKTPWKRVNTEL
jgi:hypothetical protein